jgi:hypothetical protein
MYIYCLVTGETIYIKFLNYQEKIDLKSVITQDMLFTNPVLDYTQLIMFNVKVDQLTNIFLQKLAKMNYSVFLSYASLFINSTFINQKINC